MIVTKKELNNRLSELEKSLKLEIEFQLFDLEKKVRNICPHKDYVLKVGKEYVMLWGTNETKMRNFVGFSCEDCGYHKKILKGMKDYDKYLKEYKKREIKKLGELK